MEAKKLAGGDELSLNGKRWRAGVMRKAPASYAEKRSVIMNRVFELKNIVHSYRTREKTITKINDRFIILLSQVKTF
ncbi:hypothetical protein [Serratia proteamaculans]|uniref:hypothetical protein n=1 Tax=Serratia proteamaculans TaxID=28151 RepID=UPI0024BB043A|nr:hypothetical protein [Serratia proteamaculans]